MGMGSYSRGMLVKIPFQLTDGGIPITDCQPFIEKIVLPSGALASGFPASMQDVDRSLGTFDYEYYPPAIGDYIVIITTEIDGAEYVSIENFTVKEASTGSSSGSGGVPRAESR